MNGARAGTARRLAGLACALHDLTISPEQRDGSRPPPRFIPVDAHADGLGDLLDEVYRPDAHRPAFRSWNSRTGIRGIC